MAISGTSGAQSGEFPLPVGHKRLGANQQHALQLARVQQQANGRDRLHRFAQAHLVRQHGRDSRIEKRHAFELIRKRHERKIERAVGDQRFQRRLKDIEQTVFKFHDIARRLEPRDRRGKWRSGGQCFHHGRFARLRFRGVGVRPLFLDRRRE